MDLSHRVPKLTLVPASWKKNIRTCHQESNPHSLWEREPQRKARDGFFTPPVAPAWVKATGDPHHTAYHHFGSLPKTMLNSAPFIKHVLKQADHLGDSSPSHINTASHCFSETSAFPKRAGHLHDHSHKGLTGYLCHYRCPVFYMGPKSLRVTPWWQKMAEKEKISISSLIKR